MINCIENEVINDINRIILEELTVSNDVLSSEKLVKDYIINNIQSQEDNLFADGGATRNLSFSMKLFNDELNVHFNVINYNFKNESYYKQYLKKKDIDIDCTSVFRGFGSRFFAMCSISYISINFKPMPKFSEDVHHELNHIYQQFKDGDTYGNALKMSSINSDVFSDDERRRDVGNLLYFANEQEQDSFVSSVYSYVKHNFQLGIDRWNIDELIKETDAFKNICKLKELYKKINSDRKAYRDIILIDNGFKRWDRFDKRIKNAIDRFERKFSMVVKKCKKDFVIFESHTWCDMGSYRNLYLLNL